MTPPRIPITIGGKPEMRFPDYHTHTARCGHAYGRTIDYVETARQKGLAGIGIAVIGVLAVLSDRRRNA